MPPVDFRSPRLFVDADLAAGGTAALQALYKGVKPAMLEQRTDLAPEFTRAIVRTGVSVMPFFRKTEISDAELDALAKYLAHK